MFKNTGFSELFSAGALGTTSFLPWANHGKPVPLLNIATRDIASLSLNDSLSDAARIMVQRCISSIVVEDDDDHPLGIVTERNILHAMQSGCAPVTSLKEAMSAPVITVPETLDCQAAYQLCLQKNIRHLVMVDAEGVVTGVVSETDFRQHMNLAVLAGRRLVASVMSSSVLSLPPDAGLRDALNLMQARHDSCVVVTEAGHPVGIITERDVVRFFANDPQCTVAPLREVMVSPVKTIASDATLHEAAAFMLAAKTRHLAVVGVDGQLAGMVREHDLIRSVASDLMNVRLDVESTFLRTLVNTIPDLVWLKDHNGVFQACNAAFERLLGAKECDIIGKTDLDFVDAKQAAVFRERDQSVITSNHPCRSEEWLNFADGYRGLFETIRSSMRDSTGKLIGVLGIARDITANRQAQETRERDFRSLAENLPDNISRWDIAGRYLYVNPSYEHTLGRAVNTLVGTESQENCKQLIAQVVATGQAITFAHQSMLVDGAQQIHDVTMVPERDDEGRIVSVLGLGRNMTEIYRLQDELSARERELRALAEISPGMMGTFYARPDGSMCMPYVSQKIKELFGLQPQDVLNDASALLALTHPDDAQRVADTIAASARDMTTWHEEYRIIHPLRGERWMESNTHPQPHPLGGIVWYGYVHDITERKLMEQQLQLKEFVLDQAHEAVYLMNRDDLSFVYVNHAACRSLGYSREELLTLTLREIDQETTPEMGRAIWEKVIANGSHTFEARHWRRDGSHFPVEIQGSIFEYEGLALSLSLVRDITERKRAEMALQCREREFRSLAENLPDNIARWDLEGRYLYINPTHERTLGVAAIDLIGKKHPSMHHRAMVGISQVVESGQTMVFAREPVLVNGATQIHDISVVPERDADGCIVSILGIGRDMTDLYRMQDAIAAREQEFRSLAESSPDSIAHYDLEQRMLYLNKRLVQHLSLASEDEVLGLRPIEVWPDGRFAVIDAASKRAIKSGNKEVVELIRRHDDGELNIGQILVVPERGVDGKIIGTIAFGRDITAIREGERRLAHFIDNLPGLAFTFRLTPEGRGCFPYMSSAIKEYYGLEPSDVMSDMAQLHALAHPDDQPRIEAAIAESVQTQTGLHIEFRVCRPGHPERWFDVRSVPGHQPDGTSLWYGIMLDVTERIVAEQSEKEHLYFLESMDLVNKAIQGEGSMENMMSSVLDVVLSVFDCDRAFLLYPCDPGVATWMVPMECHRPEYPGAFSFGIQLQHDPGIADKLRLLLDADGPVTFGGDAEHDVPPMITDQFQVQSLMSMAIYPQTGSPWEFGIQQCSEARNWKAWELQLFQAIGRRLGDSLSALLAYQDLLNSEEQLRQSNKQLMDISMRREGDREDERKRIAREIHDELGQNLTALRMSISQLRFQFSAANPELANHIEHMHKLATTAIQTVRDVTKSLRPPVLDAGIYAALLWLVNEFQNSTQISYNLSLPSGSMVVDDEHAMAIFRIVQESLTNVVRHAHATKVDITVQAASSFLHISIRDNGQGFDTEKNKMGGFGLIGMSERTRMTGGSFDVHSKRGGGTSVTVIIPAQKQKEML
ncbi:MAG: diguanylate cyclase with PAS/PAC sensor [Comamonadaceae bacterium]|nr:MAG: diguanylate cyclase with PAS/PAC sensor [Comamonadaceae bacterium]